jgi:hypothetical protein
MKLINCLVLFSLLALFSMAVAPCFLGAQTMNTGSITGTVVDQTGAVVPNVDLELRDVARNQKFNVKSGSVGDFSFKELPPSTYELAASKPGFQQILLTSLVVEVATNRGVVVTLKVGGTNEVVQVNAEFMAPIQAEGSQLGTTIGGDMIMRLPAAKRDAGQFLTLQPGVMPVSGTPNNGATVNGMRSDQSAFFIDGMDITDQVGGSNSSLSTVIPLTQDSVAEFKLSTAGLNATLNRSSGGQVAVIGKRGTNAFHGSSYWYNQSDKLEANEWFNDKNHIPKPPLHDNRFGGSIGGPIFKDHTFFFANYEGRRQHKFTATTLNVPTGTLDQGILQFRDAAGNINSYNLSSTAYDPRGIGISPTMKAFFAKYPQGNSTAVGDGLNYTGFYGTYNAPVQDDVGIVRLDQILNSMWRLQANHTYYRSVQGGSQLSMLSGQLVPTSDTANRGDVTSVNLLGTISSNLVSNSRFGFVRNRTNTDANSPSGNAQIVNLPGTSTNQGSVALNPYSGFLSQPAGVLTGPYTSNVRTWQAGEDLSWMRGRHSMDYGGTFRYIPILTVSTTSGSVYTSLVATLNTGSYITSIPSTYLPPTCSSTVTTSCLKSSDITNWNRLYTAALGMVDNLTYYGIRNGNLDPLPVGTPFTVQGSEQSYEFYAQDTFRATQTLSLTYGLNWGLQTPPSVTDGRVTMLIDNTTGKPIIPKDYLAQRSSAAQNGQIYNPQLAYAPLNKLGRSTLFDTYWKQFAPRAAAAWSPGAHEGLLGKLFGDRKTVFRGGFGLFYDRINAVMSLTQPSGSFGFTDTRSVNGPLCSVNGVAQNCGTGTGAPATAFRVGVDGTVPLPTAASMTSPLVPGVNSSVQSQSLGIDPTLTPGRNYQLTFTIQRELPGNLVVEAAVLGGWGRNLTQGININAFPYFFKDATSGQTFAQAFDAVATALRNGQTPAAQSWFENQLPGYGTAWLAANQKTNLTSGNVTSLMSAIDNLRSGTLSLPRFDNNQVLEQYMRSSMGDSNYRALQLTVKRRMSHGLSFDLSYTLSRSTDTDGVTQNYQDALSTPFNPKVDYGLSTFDRPHMLKTFMTYELPGTKIGNTAIRKIISGWTFSPIFQALSGLPIAVYQGSTIYGSGSYFPTYTYLVPTVPVGSIQTGVNYNVGSNGINFFANPTAAAADFRPVLLSSDNTTGRANPMRGIPYMNLDSSLVRKIALTERASLLATIDVFNVFNNPNFYSPMNSGSMSYGSGSFGNISSMAIPQGRSTAARAIQLGLRIEF